MPSQTFIDGVGEVRLSEGVVRMDLLTMSPTNRDKEGRPTAEFVEQLVMSPRAFMRLVAALSQTLKGMEEKGLISRGAEAGGEEHVEKAASPNF